MENIRWFNWLTVMILVLTPQIGVSVLNTSSILWWFLPNIPLIFMLIAMLMPQARIKMPEAIGYAIAGILISAVSFLLRDKSLNSYMTYPQLFSGCLVIFIAYISGIRNTSMIEWDKIRRRKPALALHLTALLLGIYSFTLGIWLVISWPWRHLVISPGESILPIYAWCIPVIAGVISYLCSLIHCKRIKKSTPRT